MAASLHLGRKYAARGAVRQGVGERRARRTPRRQRRLPSTPGEVPQAVKTVGSLNPLCYVEARHRKSSGVTMSGRPLSTERVAASRARQDWGKLLERVRRGRIRVLVQKNGVPVAALIAPEDLARFERIEAEQDAALARMRAAFAD